MKQPRHVPVRTCVMCGTRTAKRDLARVVLTPEGECIVDETGKRPGRGAYLCRRAECWERAASTNRLAHALRGEVRASDKERLAVAGAAFRAAFIGSPAGE
ncbi:MAG: YlxR family protein [Chloroflexi bacterium]|nr:YlxR family protein [Chloroflexota bacterium]